MTEEKKIDRLYVDKRDVNVFNRLKEKDSPFAGSQNKDVFLAAMVVGYHEGSKIELKNKEGYVREEYLNPRELALIRAIAVTDKGNLEVLLDKQEIFSIAEQYATGGIEILKAKALSGEYGSYTKKLESELLRAHEKAMEKQPKKFLTHEEISDLSVSNLIMMGETDKVEFKSSLIWDYKMKQPNKKLIGTIVARTVSSFMNSEGGVVLIGVNDDKSILGLNNDLTQLQGGADEFELHFTNLINSYIGKVFRPFADLRFEKVDYKEIAIIVVKKSPHPVYLKHDGKTEFYIRAGNSNQPLDMSESNDYIKDHWPS